MISSMLAHYSQSVHKALPIWAHMANENWCMIGAPYLPYMKVTLGNGNTLTIKADKVSDKNCYVSSVRLNGKVYDKTYLTVADIQEGGELVFDMSSTPNKKRGIAPASKPYSLSD